MKTIVVLAALVAVALAVPLSPQNRDTQNIRLTKFSSYNDGFKNYNFAYEQNNGQFHHETGEVFQNPRESRSGEDSSVLRVTGSFGWVDPMTGQKYTVNYVADENGFQPQGAHLPSL